MEFPLINKKFKFGLVPIRDVEILAYVSHIKNDERIMITNHFHRISADTEGIVVVYYGNPFKIKMRGQGFYYKKK